MGNVREAQDEDTQRLQPLRLMSGAHVRGIQSAIEKFLYFYGEVAKARLSGPGGESPEWR